MKQRSNLFTETSMRPNLACSAVRAARGKRHRAEVRDFFREYESRVTSIGSALRQQNYKFAPYREFPIVDPKSRIIHAPVFQDRVVHHAIVRVAGPVFESGAIAHSFACRQGKGLHAALKKAKQWIHAGDWFFKADIRKFYDSVSHDVLRNLLRRRFREQKLLSLFDVLLASYQTDYRRGLPIGALTSQYLGNFYLDPLDRWAKQTMRVRRYIRYMDDMLFIGSASELRTVRRSLEGFVAKLGLSVGHHGQFNRCNLGVPWLGFTVYPNRVRLNAVGRKRVRSRMKLMEKRFDCGMMSEVELQQRVSSMFAHAQFADDIRWRRGICSDIMHWESQEPCAAWRVVHQHGDQVPHGVSQQEQGR